jgi:hypothetical protein
MWDPREDGYIQELAARIEALEKDGVAIRLNPGTTIQGPAILRTRIKSLEAAQQPQQSVPKWHRLSEREPQVGDRCIYQCPPNLLHAFGTWHDTSTEHISRKGFWNNERGLFVGDPECISWRLAMPHEIPPQQSAPATEESSATAPPATAGGLVERVSRLLAKRFSQSRPGIDCTPFARDVLREIAKWLRSDGPGWPFAASLLEREANR